MKKCIVKKFDFYEEINYLRIDFNIADYIKITSTGMSQNHIDKSYTNPIDSARNGLSPSYIYSWIST